MDEDERKSHHSLGMRGRRGDEGIEEDDMLAGDDVGNEAVGRGLLAAGGMKNASFL